MLTTYDLKSVQSFAESLNSRRRGCNDEGLECSNLDETIRCQFNIGRDLNLEIAAWTNKVFAGQVEYDPAVESIFISQLDNLLNSSRPVLQKGQELNSVCWQFEYLHRLQSICQRLLFLQSNWISPRKAIAPSRRMPLGEGTQKEIRERAAALSQKNDAATEI